MYELLRNGEPVDRAQLANLKQAKTFFMKRKKIIKKLDINTHSFVYLYT